jgi:hypothetical protein
MPPLAIARSARTPASVSPRASRKRITDALGNFGARPQPPCPRSSWATSASTARSRSAGSRSSPLGFNAAAPASASATRSPCSRISARLSRHALATASSTWRHDAMPIRGSGGK